MNFPMFSFSKNVLFANPSPQAAPTSNAFPTNINAWEATSAVLGLLGKRFAKRMHFTAFCSLHAVSLSLTVGPLWHSLAKEQVGHCMPTATKSGACVALPRLPAQFLIATNQHTATTVIQPTTIPNSSITNMQLACYY